MYTIVHKKVNGNKYLSIVKNWSRNMKITYEVVFCDHDKHIKASSSHRKPERAVSKYMKLSEESLNSEELVRLCIDA
ncbi:MAG: hypothetical protein WC178_04270 [Candidatus Paceibacterota bacterium]